MTEDEIRLLLYLEERCVNHAGRVNIQQIDATLLRLARKWHLEGFIEFKVFRPEHQNLNGSYWCRLSDRAWEVASRLRKNRADITWTAETKPLTD